MGILHIILVDIYKLLGFIVLMELKYWLRHYDCLLYLILWVMQLFRVLSIGSSSIIT
jgi:hypothetical protein